MNIAVTGANGHVGINLCLALQAKGHFVRALSHNNDFGLKHIKVESFKGDLLNKDSLQSFLVDIDVVVHLAAKISIQGDPDGSVKKINIEGTRNILDISRQCGIKRFIHFSSIHALKQEPLNEVLDELRPIVDSGAFAYDRSKAEGEKMVLAAAGNGFDTIVLCPTAIIGPVDYEPSLIGKAMLELYNHQVPALVPGGYNWVDVRDVVNGCIAAIEKGRSGEKYLLSGQWRSLEDVSSIITKSTGMKTTSVIMPFWVAHLGLPFITGYSKITGRKPLYTKESLQIIKNGNRLISNTKARDELGFNPRSLEDTIKDLFIWFRENGSIK
jgi:dihydroflavonol-4-reductase